MPYISQHSSRELVEQIISEKIAPQDDPNWEQSGAKTKEEYTIWSLNGCGMACLQMILAFRGTETNLVELGKKSLRYGCYKVNEKAKSSLDYKNYYDGLYYQPFVTFIDKEFKLKGKVVSPLVLKQIIQELEQGNFIISSVNPQIREPEKNIRLKRGHLLLIVGYDTKEKILYLHNPSGFYGKSQDYSKISFSDFDKFFAHQGILVRK